MTPAAGNGAAKERLAEGLTGQRCGADDLVVALAGNPNVGKSTIFNALTKMKQHTGNWPGKTVVNAKGRCRHRARDYVLVDIPGCYSLLAHSAEEEVARDFLCFGAPDAVVVVCDATCLERNLNLVLQVMEATPRVVVAVNLMDEARRKNVVPDLELLAQRLGTPVVGMTARSNRGLTELMDAVERLCGEPERVATPMVRYPAYIERAITALHASVENVLKSCVRRVDARWLCARLMDANAELLEAANAYLGLDIAQSAGVRETLAAIHSELEEQGVTLQRLQDDLAEAFVVAAEDISKRQTPSFPACINASGVRLLAASGCKAKRSSAADLSSQTI